MTSILNMAMKAPIRKMLFGTAMMIIIRMGMTGRTGIIPVQAPTIAATGGQRGIYWLPILVLQLKEALTIRLLLLLITFSPQNR